MPALTGARAYVSVPETEVAKGGVLVTARVIPTTGHALLGAEYETLACVGGHFWQDECGGPGCAEPKDFDTHPDMVEGGPFTIYDGVDCELGSPADNEARAKKALAYSERKLVDEAIWTYMATVAEPILPLAVDLITAIGIAENAIALRYGGYGVIYIGVDQIPEACQNGAVASTLDGRLMTCQGTPVANIIRPANVSQMLFASGQLTLLQGPVLSYATPPMTDCDNLTTSPARALAERTYVPLFECAIGAINFVE